MDLVAILSTDVLPYGQQKVYKAVKYPNIEFKKKK